jgi:hypothetical protein
MNDEELWKGTETVEKELVSVPRDKPSMHAYKHQNWHMAAETGQQGFHAACTEPRSRPFRAVYAESQTLPLLWSTWRCTASSCARDERVFGGFGTRHD